MYGSHLPLILHASSFILQIHSLHPFTSLCTEQKTRIRPQPTPPSFFTLKARNFWESAKNLLILSYWHGDQRNIDNNSGRKFFQRPKKLIAPKVNISMDTSFQRYAVSTECNYVQLLLFCSRNSINHSNLHLISKEHTVNSGMNQGECIGWTL